MLQSLHVKNLALMEETEISFRQGLNILTGETGAGKSILIGSINLALGGKFEKEMLRQGAESASVELYFEGNEKTAQKLDELDLEKNEDGGILISRKMQVGRSVFRINGEVVTGKVVKELAELLIDIHGQHEHQSLLRKSKHLEILDEFGGQQCYDCKKVVAEAYQECKKIEKLLKEEILDETTKEKERALAAFEYQEIEAANLKLGEDEELETQYRLMVNGKKIMEGMAESIRYSGNEDNGGAGDAVSRALRAISSVSMYDSRLADLESQLAEIESLLNDYNRDASSYMDEFEFDEETLNMVEERLNQINHLKGKYGHTIEAVLQYMADKQALLQKLEDYDSYIAGLKKQLDEAQNKLLAACDALTLIRQKNSKSLAKQLKDALVNLNFLTVEFEIKVEKSAQPTEHGYDDVEFMISVNPGEALRPLSQVASGGELSRIMLAIKTVLAGKDDIDTLIFDEIDTGISGKTAWKVSTQLNEVALAHQVICITHLPQIAAMADTHFMIEKSSQNNHTVTDIRKMEEKESLGELARLLGSDELTSAALENAQELKNQALQYKKK